VPQVAIAVSDNLDGMYSGSFAARRAGNYSLLIFVDGEMIHGSPFAVQVLAGALSPADSYVVSRQICRIAAVCIWNVTLLEGSCWAC
jgi:hypothetical protein